jgi:hypothetical protein
MPYLKGEILCSLLPVTYNLSTQTSIITERRKNKWQNLLFFKSLFIGGLLSYHYICHLLSLPIVIYCSIVIY